MEDVRSVLMDKDTLLLLAIAVSARVVTTVDDKHSQSRFMGAIGSHSTVESGPDNEQIVFECKIQNAECKIKNYPYRKNRK